MPDSTAALEAQPHEPQRPWTVPEYARYWNTTPKTVHSWIEKGWLPSAKIGGLRRIMPEHHEHFVKNHTRTSA